MWTNEATNVSALHTAACYTCSGLVSGCICPLQNQQMYVFWSCISDLYSCGRWIPPKNLFFIDVNWDLYVLPMCVLSFTFYVSFLWTFVLKRWGKYGAHGEARYYNLPLIWCKWCSCLLFNQESQIPCHQTTLLTGFVLLTQNNIETRYCFLTHDYCTEHNADTSSSR